MSRKLSLGRRLMLGASHFIPPSSRWRWFRRPAGVCHLSEIQIQAYRHINSPPESTLGRSEIDVQHDRLVFRIDHGFTTHPGATLLHDGTLVRELSREWRTTPDGHAKLQKPSFRPGVHHVSRAASIAIEHNSNYCHFFYDCLPRIPILRESGFGDLPLYAPLAERFQQEILELLGYTPEKRIASVQHPILQADELYIPSYAGKQGEFPAEVRRFIKDELLGAARRRVPGERFPRLLYISRNDSTSRRIVDEEIFYQNLKPLGFEFLVMAELPMTEQILAFADAGCIVTAHGASLTNLVFCRPECVSLEIFPERLNAPCYQDLARLLNMRCFEYRAEGIQIGSGDLAQNIRIGPELMRTILEQVRTILKP